MWYGWQTIADVAEMAARDGRVLVTLCSPGRQVASALHRARWGIAVRLVMTVRISAIRCKWCCVRSVLGRLQLAVLESRTET